MGKVIMIALHNCFFSCKGRHIEYSDHMQQEELFCEEDLIIITEYTAG